MRKYRGLIIGLGLGLMLGAAMLQLILTAESMSLPSGGIASETLEEEAEAQGFALVPAGEKTYSQQELDRAVAEAVKNAAAGGGTETGGTSEADASASPSPEASPAPAPAPEKLVFYIRANATLKEVATALKGLALIEDEDAFIREARSYSGKLRVGPSVFVGKPSFEEIIEEITRAKY
ncbi:MULTISPECIES: hypothetical protein [Cohnella]|uniref:hypothetical protein n=1 Tax=Cohnella TaxID=329857 RepID=UPI0009B9CA14|nr:MULTISPECIES: hypothetical protein [Cohnella]MBN2983627.1 hypothetical protein [Cohnella algarum]